MRILPHRVSAIRPVLLSALCVLLDASARAALPSGYAPIEYVECTGKQYINT